MTQTIRLRRAMSEDDWRAVDSSNIVVSYKGDHGAAAAAAAIQ